MWVLTWLSLSNLKTGPLFRRFKPGQTGGKKIPLRADYSRTERTRGGTRTLHYTTERQKYVKPLDQPLPPGAKDTRKAQFHGDGPLPQGQYEINGIGFNFSQVNISEAQWESTLKKLFTKAKLPRCSAHSIRRSAAIWAARCGARTFELQQGGRWSKNSSSFFEYFIDGQSIVLKWERIGDDPIFRLWCYTPAGMARA